MSCFFEFGLNLLASIVGSAITMWIAYLWKFRRLFEKSNFRNQKNAENNMITDITKSKSLRVFAMCGSSFSDKINSGIAKKVAGDLELKQYYLVSAEDNPNILERQSTLPKGADELKTKIANSINDFNSNKSSNPNIEIRLHKKKAYFRLILLDHCLYFSQQEEGKYGKDTEIQRIKCDTPTYKNFMNYFNSHWEEYAP